MKKIIAVLMALTMVVCFAGCGKDDAAEDLYTTDVSGAVLGAEAVTINFWHSVSDQNGVVLEQIVNDFNNTIGQEKQITVKMVYQGKYSDATTKLKAILNANQRGTLPDVMQMDATAKVLYATSEYAYTLDEILADHPEYDASDLFEAAMEKWNYQGVQLGIPFAASTTVTYYNKTILDKLGLQRPETLADVKAINAAMTENSTEVEATLTCLPNSATINDWIIQIGGEFLDCGNGTEGNATKVLAADDGSLVTFLTEWKDLYNSGALKNADTTTTDEFVSGKSLMMIASTSKIASILSKVDGRFEVGVAPFLKVNENASSGAASSGSAIMAFDTGDALRMQASWEFMKFMTEKEAQGTWAAGTGYLPVSERVQESKSYQELIEKMPQYAVGLDQLTQAKGFVSVTVGPSADVYYAVQNNVSEMLEKDLTPEETAKNIKEEIEGILMEYAMANP